MEFTPRSSRQAPAGSILDLPDEASDLWAPRSGGGSTDPLQTPGILQAARDALLAAFADPPLRQFLDPFAPAGQRNAAVIAALREAIGAQRRSGGPLAAVSDEAHTLLALFAATVGWGPAQRYLDDPQVDEVKINGRTIMVQEAGRPFVVAPERFAEASEVRQRALQLASALGVRLDASHPQETLPVAHGTRVHVTIAPRIADEDGALVCIRRGRRNAWDLDDLTARAALDVELASILRLLCAARCSFLIAGRTGAGKTGMLEALANSWPGEPHVISIEDHSLEIGIRAGATWTRELVDTQRDPHAFGRAAREALRQTPGLLLPGETRGNEAGAILALALSGHPVITTLHARTIEEAAMRFAGYAAQPGAYMYDGRRDDSLADTCSAFDVVVLLDTIEASGRRFVAEVALLAGTASRDGRATPATVTLARAELREGPEMQWRRFARVESGTLVWEDGRDRTPPRLRERLARAVGAATRSTSLDRLAQERARAEHLLAAGDAERALAILSGAWETRHDPALLTIATRALALAPDRFSALRDAAQLHLHAVEQAIAAKQWRAAARLLAALNADIGSAAAAGATVCEKLETETLAGLQAKARAEQSRTTAAAALQRGEPRTALDALNAAGCDEGLLAPATLLPLLQLREAALSELLRRGEGSAEAAATLRTRRAALEALLTEEGATNDE
jgi:Flp pilus assembly CpaF family ATPase